MIKLSNTGQIIVLHGKKLSTTTVASSVDALQLAEPPKKSGR